MLVDQSPDGRPSPFEAVLGEVERFDTGRVADRPDFLFVVLVLRVDRIRRDQVANLPPAGV